MYAESLDTSQKNAIILNHSLNVYLSSQQSSHMYLLLCVHVLGSLQNSIIAQTALVRTISFILWEKGRIISEWEIHWIIKIVCHFQKLINHKFKTIKFVRFMEGRGIIPGYSLGGKRYPTCGLCSRKCVVLYQRNLYWWEYILANFPIEKYIGEVILLFTPFTIIFTPLLHQNIQSKVYIRQIPLH